MNRGLMILLLCSLAANVFLAGFVGGRVLGESPHAKGERRAPPPGGMIMIRDFGALPPDARESFRVVFRDRKPELRQSYHELRRRREAFAEALAADVWDRARVETALNDLRAVEGAHQTTLAHLIIDAFEGLSADERKAVIEAQAKRRDAWRDRRKIRIRKGPGEKFSPPPDDEETEDSAPLEP